MDKNILEDIATLYVCCIIVSLFVNGATVNNFKIIFHQRRKEWKEAKTMRNITKSQAAFALLHINDKFPRLVCTHLKQTHAYTVKLIY